MPAAGWRFRFGWCRFALAVGLSAAGAIDGAGAQQRTSGPRVVVTGEGSVSVAPDVVQIRSGVTTRGKTVREATEANSKTMAAILTALTESGIPQKQRGDRRIDAAGHADDDGAGVAAGRRGRVGPGGEGAREHRRIIPAPGGRAGTST